MSVRVNRYLLKCQKRPMHAVKPGRTYESLCYSTERERERERESVITKFVLVGYLSVRIQFTRIQRTYFTTLRLICACKLNQSRRCGTPDSAPAHLPPPTSPTSPPPPRPPVCHLLSPLSRWLYKEWKRI